ncbi:MAG: hypothetical protein HWN66_03945 [Candidatus Helarchaeota archaeon]|nr:hypothetical protein [Candidatus Helarchaeota archaeon]
MPKGIILVGWTNKEGFFLIYKHPATNFDVSDEVVMRIGSTHRMRNLDANVITLREKELNVVSFFSGLITSKYHITPNFVISMLLEKDENPRKYLKILPAGSEIVLSEFPVKRFDARTTSFQDILSNIGESYKQTLPKLYNALINQEIEIKADLDDFFDSIARDLDATTSTEISDESSLADLKNKIAEQEGIIKTLQDVVEGKGFTDAATEYIAKIETLKTQMASLERRNKEKDGKISELEIQLARIDLLETRIQSLQSEITEQDAEIADLRTHLTSSSEIPTGTTAGIAPSSGEIQVWKNKVLELQSELRERTNILNKLKAQLAGHFDEEEARTLLSDISQKLTTLSPLDEDLDDEMKSKYITL